MIGRGLGATVVYTNPETGYRMWDVPSWCGTFTPPLLFPQCAPPTPAQIQETTLSNMGGAAASNPAVASQISAYAAASPTSPFYCQADPELCKEYATYAAHPTLSEIVGTGSFGQTVAGALDALDPTKNPNASINILLIAGIGALVLVVLLRR